MKLTCPVCGTDSDLALAIFWRHENITDRKTDWRFVCDCGHVAEGQIPWWAHAIAILFYLVPIAFFWAAFLRLGQSIEPDWIRFLTWLLVMIPGELAGERFSTWFGSRLVEARLSNKT